MPQPLHARPRPMRWTATTLVALALLVGLALATSGRADDPPAPVQISDGALRWGVKASWRQYAGPGELSGGVTKDADGIYEFPIESGVYDPATGTTTIQAKGKVHWQSHYYPDESNLYGPPAGYAGPLDIHVLDVAIADPEVTIAADGSQLTVEAHSRNVSTWELVDIGRTPLVTLDPSAVTPEVAADVTAWDDIPTALTEQGAEDVFGGNYVTGQAVDPVAFTYTGDGGAPDFSEHWTEPDSNGLSLAVNGVWGEFSGSVTPWWVDDVRGVIHDRRNPGTGNAVEAFDMQAGVRPSAPFTPSVSTTTLVNNTAFVDARRNTLYYSSGANTTVDSTLSWDPDTKAYAQGSITPFQVIGRPLLWDDARDRAVKVQRVVPAGAVSNNYEAHEWHVATYTRQPDSSFVERRYRLPNAPTGWNQSWYNAQLANAAVAADGSIVLPRPSTLPTQAGVTAAPVEQVGVQRITLDDATETASVSEIPGSGVAPADQSALGYNRALASANGDVAVVKTGASATPTRILQLGAAAGGGLVALGDPVSLTQVQNAGVAIDPVDGTVWHNDNKGQRLTGVRDARVVFSKTFDIINTRTTTTPTIGTLANRDVWIVSSDGTPASASSSTYGYARFRFDGYSPTVTGQPQPASATLGVGEQSESASFTSTASGDPAPDRQWQVKGPGASRFVDIDGATGATLTVEATRGLGGARYRAVYSNPAGALATNGAELAVAYAPEIAVDVANVSVKEGADGVFQVLPGGEPTPAVTWQRRVSGFWQAIDPTDDNFDIDGGTLTVKETNTDQSGSLFRAKLTNSVATVYSRAAKLAVSPQTTIPDGGLELENVSLDWTGNGEIQKAPPFGGSNYLSAGVSDGNETTYDSAAGNVAIYQLSSLGIETPATWLTRASHVSNGGRQLVRLFGGDATIAADGSATVEWDGSFSVNFYGGMVPFTFTDPRLTIGEDGTGALTADLSGYGSDQANPNEREPLTPVADVTVATFSGIEVDPAGAIAIVPHYAGVEAALPVGATPQDRTVAGWGAWPQAFVDFHLSSGLASYWYSSGGAADQHKRPDPFTVDFDGDAPPVDPPPADPGPNPQPHPKPELRPASIVPFAQPQTVGGKRLARLATLACPRAATCKVTAPKRVTVKIVGKRYRLAVLAPAKIASGKRATLRVRLPKAAAERLRGRRATVRLDIAITANGERTSRKLRAIIQGR